MRCPATRWNAGSTDPESADGGGTWYGDEMVIAIGAFSIDGGWAIGVGGIGMATAADGTDEA